MTATTGRGEERGRGTTAPPVVIDQRTARGAPDEVWEAQCAREARGVARPLPRDRLYSRTLEVSGITRATLDRARVDTTTVIDTAIAMDTIGTEATTTGTGSSKE